MGGSCAKKCGTTDDPNQREANHKRLCEAVQLSPSQTTPPYMCRYDMLVLKKKCSDVVHLSPFMTSKLGNSGVNVGPLTLGVHRESLDLLHRSFLSCSALGKYCFWWSAAHRLTIFYSSHPMSLSFSHLRTPMRQTIKSCLF